MIYPEDINKVLSDLLKLEIRCTEIVVNKKDFITLYNNYQIEGRVEVKPCLYTKEGGLIGFTLDRKLMINIK